MIRQFAMVVAAIATGAPAAAQPASPARAVQLRVEHLLTPLGVDAVRPRFSWQMADRRRGVCVVDVAGGATKASAKSSCLLRRGARQSAYQLRVATSLAVLRRGGADVWDGGLVTADSSVDVTYAGPALAPRTRYWWAVCIRDGGGRAAPCAYSWWETGMMSDPWRATWIAASNAPLDTVAPTTADTAAYGAGRVPLLRRSFRLVAAPVRARIYATALGSYRLTMNGAPAGPGVLVPDWTDYRYRVTYQTYDVTRLLRRGANALGVVLGAGWYAGRMGYSSTRYAYGPPPVRLLLELHVSYADGHEEVIASDTAWRAASGPILFSEIYDGEAYDARLEQPGWDRAGGDSLADRSRAARGSQRRLGNHRPGFDASGWHEVIAVAAPSAELQSQNMPPIEPTTTLHPRARWSPRRGVWVFDFGQNFAGWARLSVRGPRGTLVRMRFAEILDRDGKNITQINLRSAKATDSYVLRGRGPETFEPHFTYHGFRYVEVTGFPGTPGLGAVAGIAANTALPETAELVTSSAALNRLWRNIVWTQRANLYSVPTDCPQRDERMGWMGDAQVFWRTASYDMDMTAFGEKWLADVRDAQTAWGCFPNYAPDFIRDRPCGAPGWADAGVIVPWTVWKQSGDTRVLAEEWDAIGRYLKFIADSNPDFLWRRGKQTQFGDWLPAGSTRSWGETNTDLIATAFWAYDAALAAEMARALGKEPAAAAYDRVAASVRSAFDSAYVRPDGRVGAPFTNPDSVHSEFTQTGYVLALRFGLVPDTLRGAAARHLVDDIAAHGWHLTTGFLGSSYVLPVLSDAGQDSVAFRLLFQESFPSWLYEVRHGATTIWERWNGDHGDPGMNSYAHYAFGAVGEWLYRYLAGIDEAPGSVGYGTIAIRPRWSAPLTSVRAVYHSPRGVIASAWRRLENGSIEVTVTIPANTAGRVYLRTGPVSVEAGTYRFVVR